MLQINLNPFPVLETQRLVLRQTVPGDVAQVFFLRSDPGVMKYIDKERCKSLDEANEHITKLYKLWVENEGIGWAITLKNSVEMIGFIGIWNIHKEHHRAEIGYVLHSQHHGHGIMPEAAKTVIKFALNNMHLHSLEAIVNPGNEASIKLLERCHFMREGYYKENYFFNGQFLDSAVYSLLASNFKP